MFCKKGVLKNVTKFTGKHLCQSLFSNKVADWGQKHLQTAASRVNTEQNTKKKDKTGMEGTAFPVSYVGSVAWDFWHKIAALIEEIKKLL